MLLDSLHRIIKKGLESPLELWNAEFHSLFKPLLPRLLEIAAILRDTSETKKRIEQFLTATDQAELAELDIAQGFYFIAELFKEQEDSKSLPLVQEFVADCTAYLQIAQKRGVAQEMREDLKKSMSAEKQKEYDYKLCYETGMMYCLEYYLSIYKAIKDAPTTEEKKKFFDSDTVDVGTGDVPGLIIDFKNEEVAEKFLNSILEDALRIELSRAYYFTRKKMMTEKSLDGLMLVLKWFITVIFQKYEEIGIHQLASHWFTPYGRNPKIKDINL